MEKIKKSNNEWKTILAPEQFRILREKNTEAPFTGKLLYNKKKGLYVCAACGNKLFRSNTKYESGTGWPSFWDTYSKSSVVLKKETGPMGRIEVMCNRCGSHLGHVFDDGPKPTGKHYCINSASLVFNEKKGK